MLVEILPSTAEHAKRLSMHLREADIREAKALGLYPHRGVFYAYRHACYRKTALVDGVVAAMWGLHGELLGQTGQPYLITGTAVEKISPIRFAKIYKQEVKIMKEFFPVLQNYVDASYTGAVRMLDIAGFDLSEKIIFNGHEFIVFKMVS